MFFSPKIFLRDKWNLSSSIGVLLCQLFMWIYAVVNIHPTVEQVFLHYNVIFGVDLVGDWWKVFLVPLFSFLIIVINFLIALWFYSRDKLFSRFILLSATVFNLMAAIGLYLVVGLNI